MYERLKEGGFIEDSTPWQHLDDDQRKESLAELEVSQKQAFKPFERK